MKRRAGRLILCRFQLASKLVNFISVHPRLKLFDFLPELLIFIRQLLNLASPVGWPDWVFGTLATFLSCIFISYLSPRMLIAAVWPVAFNALIVGAELTFVFGDFFYLNAIYVALGELAVLAAGYVLFFLLMRNKAFMAAVRPTIHLSAKW